MSKCFVAKMLDLYNQSWFSGGML